MYAGLEKGRYATSPPKIYDIEAGAAAQQNIFEHDFERDSDNVFGKYGLPNELQLRNGSSNRLTLIVNYKYRIQIPPLLLESYPIFEEEGIKNVQIENMETFATDDLIQIIVKKSITQDMVNAAIMAALTFGRLK
ncbi:hypothetical protein [Methanolapillus millepedarum]|uniref:Uncharacterized protein n=1 Tax=Methanolapillus millepedarum TaxID=3028296 RepID=A0AA96V2I9_9EURY|nr:hypothetical protein MsAc7_03310 [Methanosarcinaceae archaeon Ac7]